MLLPKSVTERSGKEKGERKKTEKRRKGRKSKTKRQKERKTKRIIRGWILEMSIVSKKKPCA